ncbi:hypothetical protein PsorP6_010162 [Peronosclerospora sorghi]|uniref:Uncharacterized protein n=1 Tax=Peronosclerospora sorghi TaxID=230839 RepID=A0ACC0VXS6_9STRA|nr:hypothetical protein PsorP6_010162 [Peronosclerospora sorghi]
MVASFQWPRHTSETPVEKVPMLMTTMLVTTLACMVTSWSSESWSVVQMEVVMALRKRSDKGCTCPTARGIGLNTVVPLAPDARALARTTAYLLKKKVLYAVTPSLGAKINPFVQQYYLTFLLETIAAVLIAEKKKHANTFLLVELMNPKQSNYMLEIVLVASPHI